MFSGRGGARAGADSTKWSWTVVEASSASASAGLTDQEFADEWVVGLLRVWGEHELDRGLRHLANGLGDDGERWPAVLGLLGAVESDDREIVGHADAPLVRGPEQADRLEVRAGEDRGGGIPEGQQALPAGVAALARPFDAGDGAVLQVGGVERL